VKGTGYVSTPSHDDWSASRNHVTLIFNHRYLGEDVIPSVNEKDHQYLWVSDRLVFHFSKALSAVTPVKNFMCMHKVRSVVTISSKHLVSVTITFSAGRLGF
jgi:hypothetical protein